MESQECLVDPFECSTIRSFIGRENYFSIAFSLVSVAKPFNPWSCLDNFHEIVVAWTGSFKWTGECGRMDSAYSNCAMG